MPSSFVTSVPGVIHLLGLQPPTFLVDIGPGFGKYGLMAREYFNPLIVDAIEVPQGRLPTQDAIYSRVIEADARELPEHFWTHYDTALLIDVIEHMTLEEGHDLLWRLQAAGVRVIVSTPKVFEEQHDERNPHETHVCVWAWEDFEPHGVLADESTIDSIIYLLPPLAPPTDAEEEPGETDDTTTVDE